MSTFSKRSVDRTKTLGERLQKVREEAGHTLADVEAATQIRQQYLAALEGGNYAVLPGTVYIENFLKTYAEFLKVDPAYVLELYHQNEKRVLPKQKREGFVVEQKPMPRSIISPQLIRRLLAGLIVAAGLTYLGFVVIQVFSPPTLLVESPDDFSTVTEQSIEVSGVTEPETIVTINGHEVFLDSDGRFSEMVTVNEGINPITVTSSKKRSKPTEVVRTVLLELPSEE